MLKCAKLGDKAAVMRKGKHGGGQEDVSRSNIYKINKLRVNV